MKRLILISISIFLLTNIIYSQDIINETGKDGKFIVRNAAQQEALIIEDGNVAITGELKIDTMTKGKNTDAMVVWDRDDKSLKVVPRVFSKVSPLSEPLNTGIGHSIIRGNPLDEDGNEISASVQGTAAIWNRFDTDYGYIRLGPANGNWAHIDTDRKRFFFTKPIRVKSGIFSSHLANDIRLQTKGVTRMTIKSAGGNVGIGTGTPQGRLDIVSTEGALIVPRMTTTQRDVLATINGSIIYNTTVDKFNFYENGSWMTK